MQHATLATIDAVSAAPSSTAAAAKKKAGSTAITKYSPPDDELDLVLGDVDVHLVLVESPVHHLVARRVVPDELGVGVRLQLEHPHGLLLLLHLLVHRQGGVAVEAKSGGKSVFYTAYFSRSA